MRMLDSEVVGGQPRPGGYTMIGSENFTLDRVEVVGGNRGILCARGCSIRDSWVHGQFVVGDLHVSAIRLSQTATVIHNSVGCDAPHTPEGGGCSGNLVGYGDFEPVRDNLIKQNLFLATPAGFCVYGGSSGDDGSKPYGDQAANIEFIDNVFQKGPTGNCGEYGPVVSFDATWPGNSWAGNQWSDGNPILTPEN